MEIPDAIILACSQVKKGNEKLQEYDKFDIFKMISQIWDDYAEF